jgi:hypothetical protein
MSPFAVTEFRPRLNREVRDAKRPGLCPRIDSGADINCRSPQGETPLIACAQDGAADVCRILLQRGAKPELVDASGRTALDFAKDHVRRLGKGTAWDQVVEALQAVH